MLPLKKKGVVTMERVLMDYLRVSQHLSRQLRSHFGKLDLTFPQALVLNVLGEEGPMPISRLAQRIGSANSTISGIVDRLERMELARRTRFEGDHRVIYVEVTEKYQQLKSQAETGAHEYFEGLLDKLEPEEREAVFQGLRLFDRALSEEGLSQ